MKKLIVICLIIMCIVINFPIMLTKNISLNADTKYYGQALSTGVYFYSAPIDDNINILFEIPSSYFVELISDENDNFYQAKYIDLSGFVKKSDVSCVESKPSTPYAENIGFRVFVPSGANLRQSPNQSYGVSNLVISIPFLETNLVYYGIKNGEEAILYKGTAWYYCKYITANKEYSGYVYSPLCDLLPTIPTNAEKYNYVIPNFLNSSSEKTSSISPLNFNTPIQIVIIVAVSLPCLLIIYLLFKPTKVSMQTISPSSPKKKNTTKTKKIKRLKNSDYYEFDSDYFDN